MTILVLLTLVYFLTLTEHLLLEKYYERKNQRQTSTVFSTLY